VRATVTGGTGNNIVAVPNLPLTGPGMQLISLQTVAENSGPITLDLGDGAKPLLTNGGQQVAAGEVKANDMFLLADAGVHYRLYADPSSLRNKEGAELAQHLAEAAQFAAQAAQAAAEAARDIAAGYASDAVSQGNVPIYATAVGVASLEIPVGINAFRTNGYYAAGDGGGALYKSVEAEPTRPGKIQSGDGAWWEIAEVQLNVKMLGARGNGEPSDTQAFQDTVNCLPDLESHFILNIPAGQYAGDLSTIDLGSRSVTWCQLGAVSFPTSAPPGALKTKPFGQGAYFNVEYSSDRSNVNQYGYTANVTRTGGTARPVAAQLNAFDLSTTGTPSTVFGIACEAWTGNFDTEPMVAAGVKGIESAIIQQRHDSEEIKWGVDVVFKNRKDGGSILHGSIGDNKFNYGSRAINISSQGRTVLGEFCGWKTGIYFAASSLDFDLDGGAVGIDFADAPTQHMAYAVRLGQGQFFGLSGGAPNDVKMRYLASNTSVQILNGNSEAVAFNVVGISSLRLGGNQVLRTRIQGWAAPTGQANRSTFDTGSVSTAELAQRVKALIDDLTTHGLIGA